MGDYLKYDGVDFNVDKVKQMTEEQFIHHRMHANHYTRLKPEDKLKVLTAAYRTITGRSPDNENRTAG